MTQEQWSQVDEYIVKLLVPSDDALEAALARQHGSRAAGDQRRAQSGQISVPLGEHPRGQEYPRDRHARRLQHHLAGARAARGRPARHAGARSRSTPRSRAQTWPAPGLASCVSIRVGPALETLPQLAAEGPTALRLRVHRRRQAKHSRVLRMGAEADARRQRDRRGQRRCARAP